MNSWTKMCYFLLKAMIDKRPQSRHRIFADPWVSECYSRKEEFKTRFILTGCGHKFAQLNR
jgi:hypothetical protein